MHAIFRPTKARRLLYKKHGVLAFTAECYRLHNKRAAVRPGVKTWLEHEIFVLFIYYSTHIRLRSFHGPCSSVLAAEVFRNNCRPIRHLLSRTAEIVATQSSRQWFVPLDAHSMLLGCGYWAAGQSFMLCWNTAYATHDVTLTWDYASKSCCM